MRKLLIAEHSDVRIDALTEVLQQDWEIHTCVDSYPVIDTLRYIKPEAMIINLNIGPMDGLAVLKEGFPDLPPVILALTNFTSRYIEDTAARLGVDYLMPIPCRTEYIRERLEDIYNAYKKSPTPTAQHLKALGFNSKLNGYRCLLIAVPMFAADPSQQLKEILPEVAKCCNLNGAACAERDIRFAIADAWKRRSASVWSAYFPTNRDGDVDLPTSKQFIMQISEKI